MELHFVFQRILIKDHSIHELLEDGNINQETKSILKDLQDIYLSGYQKGLEMNQKEDQDNILYLNLYLNSEIKLLDVF